MRQRSLTYNRKRSITVNRTDLGQQGLERHSNIGNTQRLCKRGKPCARHVTKAPTLVMACGVLAQDGQWSAPARQPDFLFPVHALSKVFRGKFMAALTSARKAGKTERDPQRQAPAWRERYQQLYRHDWVVYAKTPLGGPAQVLDYLSSYTHRTAISNERISSVGPSEVAFKVRADAHGGKRIVRLPGVEFVRRVLQHVLPSGLKRIRHYGVLASSCKAVKLGAARLALEMPVIDPQITEPVKAFMARVARFDVDLCPCCGAGRLHVSGTLPGARQLPAPGTTTMWPQGRGPP
ncbi:hypothetical protein IWX87_003543 [Polaromonas sp. CG_9.7]|nr:hypothetical protein [Polaromonas sp. CG_9.7]MBG6115794.1 hypothetical protein [Polaromonas sp. CG_9.2]